MKLLILLTLTCNFALPTKVCTVGNNYRGVRTLLVNCNSKVYSSSILYDDEKDVSCEFNERNNTSWKNSIKSIIVFGCSFNEFYIFTNCTSVDLNDAHYSIKKDTFGGMKELRYIKFDSSADDVHPMAFSGLSNLREVVIIDQDRDMNALMFQGAHQLKILQIHYSYGLSLPIGFFHDLSNLETLRLGKFADESFTNLSAIDFTGLESMRMLTVDFTISNLTGNWHHIMKNLRYLFLSCREIPDIDSMTFSQMQNLIVLNLGVNRIKQLNAGMFVGLLNLRTLLLSKNRINRIENGTFSDLKRLKKLDLSNNQLTALHEYTFNGLDNLQYLNLKNNFISTINVNAFSALTKLIQLDLSNQYELVTVDLRAFPQFVDMQTKTVIYTEISSELEDFELEEVQWFRDILSLNAYRVKKLQSHLFKQFVWDKRQSNQTDLHHFIQNITGDSLIIGNLDLSNNGIRSINVN